MRTEVVITITLILINVKKAPSTPITFLPSGRSFAAYESKNEAKIENVQFRFKTYLKRCILVYADNKISKRDDSTYFLMMIENRKLIASVYIENSPNILLTVKFTDNVNDIKWHSVELRSTEVGFYIQLDKTEKLLTRRNFKLSSRIYFGGINWRQETSSEFTIGLKPRFQGCISDVTMSESSTKITNAILIESIDTKRGCQNACQKNLCKNDGLCQNLFTSYICDCRGTGYDGDFCTDVAKSYSVEKKNYITVNMSEQFSDLMLDLRLRTKYSYGLVVAVHDVRRSLNMAIIDGYLKIAVGKRVLTLGEGMLHDTQWHRLTLSLSNGIITISLDKSENKTFQIPEPNRAFQFPLYIGGQPEHLSSQSLLISRNFAGCFQQVYVNNLNILLRAFEITNGRKIFSNTGRAPSCQMKNENPQDVQKRIRARRKKRIEKIPSGKVAKMKPSKREENTEEKYPGYSKVLASNNKDMITWITSGVVSGAIVLMIVTACAIHYFKFKYENIFLSRVQQHDSIQRQENGEVLQMYPRQQAVIYLAEEQRAKVVSL